MKLSHLHEICFLLVLSLAFCCTDAQSNIHSLGDLTNAPADSFVYAVIGDYGDHSKGESDVAEMVKGWHPLFIITTGDNDYEDKAKVGGNIDINIRNYYGEYINADPRLNRFFPCLGNHDQSEKKQKKMIEEYFKCFPFLSRDSDYDFSWGPIHFYSLNSGPGLTGYIAPHILSDLKQKLAVAKEPFHIVFFHHPPYTSIYPANQVPDRFIGYGIDAILNGHVHYYERLRDKMSNIEYITIGCSGRNDDTCGHLLDNNTEIIRSGPCRDKQNGAVKVTVVKKKTLKTKMIGL